MAQYFTLPEAERLLPELEQVAERIRFSGGARVNPGQQLSLRSRRDTSMAALKDALDQIDRIGVLIKDLDIGLIDFLTRFQDRDVCLCWKLGEEGIRFWHGSEEGFRGRKPIDQEFLDGHSGQAQRTQLN